MAAVIVSLLIALSLGCSNSSTDKGTNPDINQPPATPSNPSPGIGEIGVSRTPNFSWSCSDADSDTLYYSLRLKIDSQITQADNVAGSFTDTSFDYSQDTLDFNTKYFWQIVAEDNDGNSTTGPIWDFTTISVDSSFVSIPDTSFRRAVVSHLSGVSESDSIYIFQVDTITALTNIGGNASAGSYHIQDITGIENFTALKTLYMFQLPLSDITPLSSLANLEVLAIYSNQITDVSPLANLSSLNVLTLNNDPISSISPLQNLTGLTTLEIDNISLTSIADLSGLTDLQTLTVRNNDITDISPVANMTQLQNLYLEFNDITDITPVQNLSLLSTLVFDYNLVDSLPSLANLTNLEEIFAANDSIFDIGNLSEMTWLTGIYLQNNLITDISALQNLTLLNVVHLSYNQIVDIKPLVDNSGITSGDQVWLDNNPLSDSSITVYIPALEARGVTVYQ
jgi:internalin A